MSIALVLGSMLASGVVGMQVQRRRDSGENNKNNASLALTEYANGEEPISGFLVQHPVDCIDDPRLAALAIVTGCVEMEIDWSRRTQRHVILEAETHFDIRLDEAVTMIGVARWLAGQGDAQETLNRLARRLQFLVQGEEYDDMAMTIEMIRRRVLQKTADVMVQREPLQLVHDMRLAG